MEGSRYESVFRAKLGEGDGGTQSIGVNEKRGEQHHPDWEEENHYRDITL